MERRSKPTRANSTAYGSVEFIQRSRETNKSNGAFVAVVKSSTFIFYLGRCCILRTGSPPSLPRQDFSVSSTFAIRLVLSDWRLLVARDTFSQRDTRHIKQSAGGECRNACGSQSRSFRFLLRSSSPCARKVTGWLAAAHLETHAADLRPDARRSLTCFS